MNDAYHGATPPHATPKRYWGQAMEIAENCVKIMIGVEDNTQLKELTLESIVDNLQARYSDDAIYTYTANVLLSVNPYKDIADLFTADVMKRYRNKSLQSLPPHPFAIADTAYRYFIAERKSQAILISGESGAGKTETAKVLINFLASVSSKHSCPLNSGIHERVVQTTPILEAFGNAQTVRNNNSSRFGKYHKLWFDSQGRLVGADIEPFLLESSRVTNVSPGERNFHIFYFLLAGLSPAQREELSLGDRRDWPLLQGGDGVFSSDSLKFQALNEAFKSVGFEEADKFAIFKTLAGLLILSDLKFSQGETVSCENPETLASAANLLGFSVEALERVLLEKSAKINNESASYSVPRTLQQTLIVQNSLLRIIYTRLFSALVDQLNNLLRTDNRQLKMDHVGILDIFGFENLGKNSFEQLCINLTNERLQQFFVRKAIDGEFKLYNLEGLTNIPEITLPDATETVSSCVGALEALDDHCRRRAKNLPTDEDKFCAQVLQNWHKSTLSKLQPAKPPKGKTHARPKATESFVIKHFAGDVCYAVDGWIEKNNDRLSPEVEGLLHASTSSWVQRLADKEAESLSCERFRSVKSKFLTDLERMLAILDSCSLHFIRCFNPNPRQKANDFDVKYVSEQVVQCGTVELVKVMHHGFPNRHSLSEIVNAFKPIFPSDLAQSMDPQSFCEALMHVMHVPKGESAVGFTTLFLKAGQIQTLEKLRGVGNLPTEEVIKQIRLQLVKKKFRRCCAVVKICNWFPTLLLRIRRKKFLRAAGDFCWRLSVAKRLSSAAVSNRRVRRAREAEEAKVAEAKAAEAKAAEAAAEAKAAEAKAAEARAAAEAAEAKAPEAKATEAAAEAKAAEAKAAEAKTAEAKAAEAAAEAKAAEARAAAEAAEAKAAEAKATEAAAEAKAAEAVTGPDENFNENGMNEELSKNLEQRLKVATAKSEIFLSQKSALIFDARNQRILAVDFSVRPAPGEPPAPAKIVNVADGSSVPLRSSISSLSGRKKTSAVCAVCQDPSDLACFASIDRDNFVTVWRWSIGLLTQSARFSVHPKLADGLVTSTRLVRFMPDRRKRRSQHLLAVVLEQFEPKDSRPASPQVSQNDSSFFLVLLEAGNDSARSRGSRPSMGLGYRVHSSISISAYSRLPATVQFMEVSPDGNFIIVGGRGVFQVMHARPSSTAAVLRLDLLASHDSFKDISACTFTSAVFVAAEDSETVNAFVGTADGNIYRFTLFERLDSEGRPEGFVKFEDCGRLRQGADGLAGRRVTALLRKATDSAAFLVCTSDGCVDEWRRTAGRWCRTHSVELQPGWKAPDGADFCAAKMVDRSEKDTLFLFDAASKALVAYDTAETAGSDGPVVVQQF